MSDLDRDGWPTADSVLRSERTKIERLERELAEAQDKIAERRQALAEEMSDNSNGNPLNLHISHRVPS